MKIWTPLMVLVASTALAETISVKSPDGLNEIRLDTEPVLQYSVWRSGTVRVEPTPISLTISGRPALGSSTNHAYVDQVRRPRAGVVAAPVYKKSEVNDNGNEVLVKFAGDWGVALHARNDGVAWRFETSFGDYEITVPAEDTCVRFPSGAKFLYGRTNNGLQSSWESVYQRVDQLADIPAGHDQLVYLPLTVEYPDGAAMCITESNVWGYPGLNFYRPENEEHLLRSWQGGEPSEVKRAGVNVRVEKRYPYLARTSGTRAYPWRVYMLASQAAALVGCDAVWALAEPCRVKDTAWIQPGATAWDWWHAQKLTDVDFKPGFDTRTFKEYIDFAASIKLPYMLVDAGWHGGEGAASGLDVDFIRSGFDLAELVRYGRERNVGLILWAAWSELTDSDRRRRIFRKYAALGIKGFKIDFFDRDDRGAEDVINRIARDAARYHLVIDFHGMHKPVGLSRTYPNVLNYEGIHGMEQEKWEKDVDFPANDVKAIYSRMLAGPMDYTPGAMSNFTRAGYRPSNDDPGSQGTRCHQLAMYIMFEAPLQMLSDSPSKYRANAANLASAQFMASVPTVWDDTVGLAGALGQWVALARRKGDVWYLGAMTDWTAREVELDTAFLGEGEWQLEAWVDADDAATKPEHYTRRTQRIHAGDKLQLRLAPGGGCAATLTPVRN